MKIAEIITPWTGNGVDGDSWRPLLADSYPVSFRDVTDQPSENLPTAMYIIEAVFDDSVLPQIEADNDYFVLWSEDVVNGE